MTCEQARELSALASSCDVTAAERQALDLHHSDCAECRVEAEGFEELLAQLGAMRDEALPESAGIAVRARVLAGIPKRHRYRWLAAWPAFAAAVACSVVSMVWLRPSTPVPQPKAPATPLVAGVVEAPTLISPAPAKRVTVHRRIHAKPAEPVVVHMFTSDPDVVIYWIADTNGKSSTTGAM